MKAVVQRVLSSSVMIEGCIHSEIDRGLLIFLGIHQEDSDAHLEWLLRKISGLRIFPDAEGKMNLSVIESGAELLVVSQFTLYADCRKGNRPSFIDAARPEKAVPFYEKFCQQLEVLTGMKVKTGVFGADMKVSLVNDGPVTLVIDSREYL